MQENPGSKLRAFTKVCFVGAIVNSLFAPAYGQEAALELRNEFPESPLQYGPFDVLYGLRGGMVYDDNIYISPQKESDVIWNIAPGLTLGAGDYRLKEENLLSLDYSPNFIFFTENSRENSIDQEANLEGKYRTGPWTLGLKQSFTAYSGAVVDVGTRSDRKVYTTSLAVVYDLSPKTSLELNGRQVISDYEQLIDIHEWVVGGWVDYQVAPLVKLGAGVNAGFVDVQPGANQTYQQGLVRAAYALTELVVLKASAGAELRKFQGPQNDRLEGIFSLGLVYRPLVNTTFSLEGYRRPQASVRLVDQNYPLTGVGGSVRQVLCENYSLSLSGGYENAHYTANNPAVTAFREDNYFFARVGADWQVLDRLTVGAFYQHRKNNSKEARFDFDNHLAGLNFSVRF